jgi:putative transposase
VVIRDLCRKHNITEQTFFRWRNKYSCMTIPEARGLKEIAEKMVTGSQKASA